MKTFAHKRQDGKLFLTFDDDYLMSDFDFMDKVNALSKSYFNREPIYYNGTNIGSTHCQVYTIDIKSIDDDLNGFVAELSTSLLK